MLARGRLMIILSFFVDGSSSNPRHAMTARGGFASSQSESDLHHVLIVHASMPGGLSQSAASCERHALVVANLTALMHL